jgi:outer membrane protein assembly factor BamD (BamD/ComL family)
VARATDDPGSGAGSSTLAAEVAALDAARTAAAAGELDRTLRLLDRYHYEFPAGELAADADVVAIEARAAQGDHAEVARLAARFLARYPNDPHAAEVRRLGGR